MGAFNGEVAIAIVQMYLSRHVPAYSPRPGKWLHEIKHDGEKGAEVPFTASSIASAAASTRSNAITQRARRLSRVRVL
jgi:hypothetical protein